MTQYSINHYREELERCVAPHGQKTLGRSGKIQGAVTREPRTKGFYRLPTNATPDIYTRER